MAPLSFRTFLPMLALGIPGASAACGSDTVAYIQYPDDQAIDDAGGGSGSGSSSGLSGGSDSSSGTVSDSSSGTVSGSSSGGTSSTSSGSSGGPATCDVSGYWLVVQHAVAVADGFKEVSHYYLYYDLSQNGTTVTVNHGLHCGVTVAADPANPLGGGDTVTFPLAGPALLARQDEGQAYGSVPPRTGTMTTTSTGCQFHLEKYYIVRGATIPYFLDPSTTMSTSMPVASGCGSNFANCTSPGSEDWDNDGNPGVTLSVSGTATGDIYAAQRDFSEYYGAVPPGATKFEVGIVDTSGAPAVGPEQYALGYGNGCSPICGLSSMVDTCPSSGCAAEFFVDWVKLDSPPASTNSGICTYVTNNAKTVAPRATDPSSVPTEPKYQ
jgi:hypothetical protein